MNAFRVPPRSAHVELLLVSKILKHTGIVLVRLLMRRYLVTTLRGILRLVFVHLAHYRVYMAVWNDSVSIRGTE